MSAAAQPFPISAKVMLRGYHSGQPGTVLRIERHKVAVCWSGLDCSRRHSQLLQAGSCAGPLAVILRRFFRPL